VLAGVVALNMLIGNRRFATSHLLAAPVALVGLIWNRRFGRRLSALRAVADCLHLS
jgi:hypothetical protein